MFSTQTNHLDTTIGYCPRCDQPILEGQATKLVLGQLFHSAHAPHAESGE